VPLSRLLLVAALVFAFAIPAPVRAQAASSALPDIGSSAQSLITPAQERLFGEQTRRQLRRGGLLIEDPLLDEWLNDMAYSLVAASDRPDNGFTFFLVRSQEINAFATLGGYIGINAGLAMAAEYEDEVAAVLAHEISHTTQRHIVRQVERSQQDSIPILLGMLAAVIAGASSGSPDAAQAAIMGGQGLMLQRQINHTRASEHEADRLGIQMLARAGYNPEAMADFFGRAFRTSNPFGFPDFLRTHPVTSTRIAEARDRARQIGLRQQGAAGGTSCVSETDGTVLECHFTAGEFQATASDGPLHPLIPDELQPRLEDAIGAHGQYPERFEWVRERMRVLSSASPNEAIGFYRNIVDGLYEQLTPAQRYGYALALTRADRAADALPLLRELSDQNPGDLWGALALAEAELRAGLVAQSLARYEGLNTALPENRAIVLSHVQALVHLQDPDAARRALTVIRPLIDTAGNDASLQQLYARAAELAGDAIRATEAYAEVALLSGRAFDALDQYQRLLARDDLDYITRSRVDARIAAITPFILELQRQGLEPGGRNSPRG
jgi:predicted Zn-dependent protease